MSTTLARPNVLLSEWINLYIRHDTVMLCYFQYIIINTIIQLANRGMVCT